jgi:hypothetical protein
MVSKKLSLQQIKPKTATTLNLDANAVTLKLILNTFTLPPTDKNSPTAQALTTIAAVPSLKNLATKYVLPALNHLPSLHNPFTLDPNPENPAAPPCLALDALQLIGTINNQEQRTVSAVLKDCNDLVFTVTANATFNDGTVKVASISPNSITFRYQTTANTTHTPNAAHGANAIAREFTLHINTD